MQAAGNALWTKSGKAHSVCNKADAIWLVKTDYYGSTQRLSLLGANLTLDKKQEAILTARHVQFCRKSCTPILPSLLHVSIEPFRLACKEKNLKLSQSNDFFHEQTEFVQLQSVMER